MQVRRSFFISVLAGLLLTGAGYFALFFLQLGVPAKQLSWLHEIVREKRRIARAITKPKLLIVAGSSAFYGINAEEIERQTGFPAANFGTNASLGPAYTLHMAKQITRPGDVVLLAFEYEPYVFGGITGTTADELFISYILGHDPEYVRGLDFNLQLKLALLTPSDHLWRGLRAVFSAPKPDAAASASTTEILANMNSHGDQLGNVPAKRPANPAVRTVVCGALAYGMPESPPGFPPIREFCEWARRNNIRVLATFPNICQRPEYDLPPAKKTPQRLREFFDSIGVPMLGDAAEAMLPEEQMFDSPYHPLHAEAIARTERLLLHLSPYLKPPPADARQMPGAKQ